jgi:hypothetical protein
MNKQWIAMLLFCGIILAIALFIIQSSNQNSTGYSILDTSTQNINNNQPVVANDNYLHYSHTDLTFSFNDISLCGDIEPNRVRKAFLEIQNQTNNLLTFKEVNRIGDITINCSRGVPLGEQPGYIVSAYGGYTNQGWIITQGQLYFNNIMKNTYSPGCLNYPDVEIHEILHTFGLQHSNNTKNIMYPINQGCVYKIDNESLSHLIEIYS